SSMYADPICINAGTVVPTPIVQNLTTGKGYGYIQSAIDEATDGDEIVVSSGNWQYLENLNFEGKDLKVRSTNPMDPSVVAATVINGRGRGPVVTFESQERAPCMLRGFTIKGGAVSKDNADDDTPLPDYMGTGGGAIACFNLYRVGPVISDCVVVGNDCAGLYCYRSSPTVINCTFAGNDSNGVELQGRSLAKFTNCTIVGNRAYGIFGGDPTVTNCSIVGNVLSGIASYRPRVGNCILWDNAPGDEQGQQIIDLAGGGSVTYSNVQGGWEDVGNIDADPCFVNAAGGDYHLLLRSPAVDAGDPCSDYSNEPWPNGSRVNMGAYGNTSEATRSPADFEDLATLAFYWLTDEPLVDIAPEPDGDGIANFLDFTALADFWLWEW
ncbi:MAG: right-handed parallel beta-helix repeat-containing protein, partial [Planctomycetota bacterium]